MKLQLGFAACLLAGSTGFASAQTMKPGLWEATTQMLGGSGEMAEAMAQAQKQMAGLSPEQRKMMQDMMAKQSGMQIGMNSNGGMRVKSCMTQESIDRAQVASHQANSRSDCTQTNRPRSGNTMQFSIVCTKPPSSGEGQLTFTSPEAYSMKMTTTNTVNGQPAKMEMKIDGHWLGSDCGTVKPFSMPKM